MHMQNKAGTEGHHRQGHEEGHKAKVPDLSLEVISELESSSSERKMPGISVSQGSIQEFIDNVFDEDFIIVENEPKGVGAVVKKALGDVTSASAGRQVAIGGVTGCVAGYLTNRVGRAVGLSLAGTFILFQVAQHKGYIKVDWAKVKRAMTRARAQARIEELKLRKAGLIGQLKNFAEENFFLTSGFVGGFALGFFV